MERVRVTINDVARAAGVSRQTVTRAVNDMPRISEETRARVLEACRDLGYRPSRFAANLARTRRTTSVGLVVTSFRNPFFSEFAAGVLAEATARGWHVTVSAHEHESEVALLSRLAPEVDVVVGTLYGPEDAIVEAARGVPVVLVGRAASRPGLASVAFDYDTGLADAVAALRRTGSRRFGFIENHDPAALVNPSDRRIAFERAVPAHSRDAVALSPSSGAGGVGDHGATPPMASGAAGFAWLMENHPETDTVLAFSDMLAIGALTAAHQREVDVPGRVRLVGIDGLALGAATWPQLSSLRTLQPGLFAMVADLVDGAIRGTWERMDRHRVITPEPVWRGTT